MILISLVAFKAFELIYLSFIKNEAAHATSEWQCLHHVLVHLAMIHSHTAPHSDFLKMFINHRPHLTISYIYICLWLCLYKFFLCKPVWHINLTNQVLVCWICLGHKWNYLITIWLKRGVNSSLVVLAVSLRMGIWGNLFCGPSSKWSHWFMAMLNKSR